MNKIWPWIIGIAVFLLLGLALLLGTGLLRTQGMPMVWFRGYERGFRDNYLPHHGMRWGLPVLGIFGMFLMLAFPLGLLAVIVLGIIMLVRSLQQPDRRPSNPQISHCSNCGNSVEPDWRVCPYCGEAQRED